MHNNNIYGMGLLPQTIIIFRPEFKLTEYLLQCLQGLTINKEKTVLEPTQSLVFLGFTVDMTKMELILPPDKLKNISPERKLENFWGRSLSQLDQ